ncbi:MAG TPA: SCP2 sterol-binding domain-containing protein [Motiliproteus sp.]
MTTEDKGFDPLGHCLDAGLGTLIEAALHRVLATDPVSLRRLAALEGKQLLLRLEQPALQLVLSPHREGIAVGGRLEGDPSSEVRATLSGLLRLAQQEGELAGEGVEIRGDTGLAGELRSILRGLDIDWEGLLGDQIGDLLAHPLAQALGRGRQWFSESRDSLRHNLDNLLHEELALVPARPQLEQYYREVDELRLAADRLQARCKRLEGRRSE